MFHIIDLNLKEKKCRQLSQCTSTIVFLFFVVLELSFTWNFLWYLRLIKRSESWHKIFMLIIWLPNQNHLNLHCILQKSFEFNVVWSRTHLETFRCFRNSLNLLILTNSVVLNTFTKGMKFTIYENGIQVVH